MNLNRLEHPKLHKIKEKYFQFGTFEQFENTLINLSIDDDSKGEIFEVYIEAFLKTTKLFNVKHVYSAQRNFPSDLFTKLEIPRTDKGIDGIIIDTENNIIPYQVKFRSSRKLSYEELQGFKDQSSRANQKILFTNCNLIAEEYFKRGNNIAFRGVDFHNLTKNEIENINNIFKNKNLLKKSDKKIDNYQLKAIESIINDLNNNDRTTCLMACGTGKTYVALWLIERLLPKKIIVFVPSIALLKQIRGDWLSNTSLENLTSFAVCSDKTEPKLYDQIKLNKKDLNFKIDTDPKEIRKFIQKKDNSTKIIFTTYHSSEAVSKACKGISFDIGIFDEAHRTTNFSLKHQETKFNMGLLNKNILIKKRVFFTATQKSYNSKLVDEYGNPKIKFNMNNPDIYGNVSYRLNFYEAQKLGAISDYRIVISGTESAELTEELRKRSVTYIKKNKIITDQIAHQVAIKKSIQKFNLSKIFTFHSRIPQTKSFAKKNKFNTDISHLLPNFYINYIEAKMRTTEREEIINNFKKSKKGLISNARCLIEGVDVPEVDAIAYVSPKKSKIDIVQSLGRAVRNRHNQNKKYGYILVPIFKEKFRSEKITEATKRSNYETISEVLDALREQDDNLDLLLNEANRNHKRGHGYFSKTVKKLSEKIIFLENEINIKNLKKHIFIKVLETFRNNWDDMFGTLLRYKDKFGNCNVPFSAKGEFKELGEWVHNLRLIRRRKKLNTLSVGNINQLNKEGFRWTFDKETVAFPTKFLTRGEIYKKFNIAAVHRLWSLVKPKGQIYSGEAGTYVDVYDLDKDKIKKILNFDYFVDEIDLKNIFTLDYILKKLFKQRNFLVSDREIFTHYLVSKKIKVQSYYDGFVVPFIEKSKFNINDFLKKEKIVLMKNFNNFYIYNDLKKKNIYTVPFKPIAYKLGIDRINKKVTFSGFYEKKTVDELSQKITEARKLIKDNKHIYIDQGFYDGSYKCIFTKRSITRYKNYLKKYKKISIPDGEYVFYKILSIKKFKEALKIDSIIRKEFREKHDVLSYYSNFIIYKKSKGIRTELILKKDPLILKKINLDFIPLNKKNFYVFKTLNKIKLKKILDNYGYK